MASSGYITFFSKELPVEHKSFRKKLLEKERVQGLQKERNIEKKDKECGKLRSKKNSVKVFQVC
jgi:hypothetical protein